MYIYVYHVDILYITRWLRLLCYAIHMACGDILEASTFFVIIPITKNVGHYFYAAEFHT